MHSHAILSIMGQVAHSYCVINRNWKGVSVRRKNTNNIMKCVKQNAYKS